MGYTRKVLSSKKVSKSPVFYTRSFKLDLAESFHFHYRNFRIEMSPKEWRAVARGFFFTWISWLLLGRPTVRPEDRHLKFCGIEDLSLEIGDDQNTVRADDLMVELQNQADYVHLHYRGSRIEFSLDEFQEFAAEIHKADVELSKDNTYDDCPRRIGLEHIIQPKGRVDNRPNIQNFSTDDKFLPEGYDQTRNSVIFDPVTNNWVQQTSVSVEAPLNKKTPGFFALLPTTFLVFVDVICSMITRRKSNATFRTFLKDLIRVHLIGEKAFQVLKRFRSNLLSKNNN
jgi:hypothetical protein